MLTIGRCQTIWLPPYFGLWPSGQDVDRNWLMLSVGRRQTIWRPPYAGLCIGHGHRLMSDHMAAAILRSSSGGNTGHDMTVTSPRTLITKLGSASIDV
ncbi:hypothetical protein DPMN_023598 [Dreissena polymorpha]|uniref:Uncharacterized protein n=1 Tax=Dreissena polymorpha TaxID=45954 RepID=A0A9D4RA21_DREPO|nr:hypothetical protein DPMN_023598 [Dreissena polymorpha]